ncbi:MAG: hypothetical protein AB7U05_07885 [Mangrovibacterium sp.]
MNTEDTQKIYRRYTEDLKLVRTNQGELAGQSRKEDFYQDGKNRAKGKVQPLPEDFIFLEFIVSRLNGIGFMCTLLTLIFFIALPVIDPKNGCQSSPDDSKKSL